MHRKLKTGLGFYSPSFMRMHVGSDKSLLKIGAIDDELTESIYLHEYMHFIQDITTSYGLSNISIVADYMRFANRQIVGAHPGGFTVPVRPLKKDEHNIDLNMRLGSVYEGSGEDDDIKITDVKLLSQSMLIAKEKKPVCVIEVKYVTPNKKRKEFQFGALCILESMAFIVENNCYPGCPPPPDLPYHSAVKLVEFICPEFGKNILNVLALCDASLQVFNPGHFFYDMLMKIKGEKKIFIRPEDVYQYCMVNRPPFDFNGIHDLKSLLIFNKQTAIDQVKQYFNDPYFDPVKEWLERMMEEAISFRLSNPTFPIDIARSGKIAGNAAFGKFYGKVGSPLVTNDLDETSIHDPNNSLANIEYVVLWAIDEIHQTFWGRQRNCEMMELCQSSGIQTDVRCTQEPWKRAEDPPPCCPYGTVWRHWKLRGYYPL